MENNSDSDYEAEIADICYLKAVLDSEEPQPSTSGTSSRYCVPVAVSTCTSISPEVQEEISRIKTAISLNKLTDEKLSKLEGLLISKLRECRERLENERSVSTESTDNSFKYLNCGKPYFKDSDNFPAPENEDTILMAKSHMYDFSSVTAVTGWTTKEKKDFTQILHKMSIDLKKKELNSKISQLQRENKKEKSKNIVKSIAAIKKEIAGVNKKSLSDLALPIDEEYDWDMVANKSNHRHSAQEYRALWRIYLHPSINKNPWSKTEQENLKRIAQTNELQDWDKIAVELGTGRTGYQCFVYFRTNMSNTATGQSWSKEEEDYLKRLIEYYREDDHIPWGIITSRMENRTKIQIYNKYLRLTEQRKGRFLPEEDGVILTCVKKFGPKFRTVMKYLPGRSMSQLRARYNVLSGRKGKKTSIVWTAEEDKKLIQLMANQDSLMNYSSITKHFPGKGRAHLRARYTTVVNWMRKHPDMDISRAPRRDARRLGHGEASQDLNNAVEKLRNRMQSEVESKKYTKLDKNSPEEAIDNAIVAALIDEMNKADEENKSKLCDSEESVLEEYWGGPSPPTNITNLQNTLILLKAKLDKTKFQNSPASQKFPELLQQNQEKSVVVKSYSKKSKVEVLKPEKPDIWGNKTLDSTKYVFPPNYSTITACRKLMAYASTTPEDDRQINLSLLAKKNVLLKEQLDIMMERFNLLFMWPLLLSNESPTTTPAQPSSKPKPPPLKTPVMSGDPGIAIPVTHCTHIVNEHIDLAESTKTEEDITVKDVHVGNDDYMFMKH